MNLFNPYTHRSIRFVLFLITALMVAQSCTVQKRQYRKGFYVHHSGKIQQTKRPVSPLPQPVAGKTNTNTEAPKAENPNASPSVNPSNQTMAHSPTTSTVHTKKSRTDKKKILAQVKELCANPSDYVTKSKQLLQQKHNLGKNRSNPDNEKKFLSSGFASFLLGIFVYLVFLTGLFLLLAQLFTYGILFLLLSALMAFTSILFALVAISNKISDGEKYYGVGFAIAGLVLSTIFMMIVGSIYMSAFR